jgi:hypothetical protein
MDQNEKQISDFAFRQLCFGLAWWSASSIAIYVSLSSTGSSVIWYGGCLVAIFNWYRSGKVWLAAKKDGLSIFKGVRTGIVIATLCLAAGTAFILGPEYLRVNTPSVGTCWAKADGELYKPIACWSSEAVLKTTSLSNSESNCPSNSEWIFPPDSTNPNYFCLEETN